MKFTVENVDIPCKVLHMPTMRMREYVEWVDADTLEWCEYLQPVRVINDMLQTVTHHAKREIKTIMGSSGRPCMFLIDPPPDADDSIDTSQPVDIAGAA